MKRDRPDHVSHIGVGWPPLHFWPTARSQKQRTTFTAQEEPVK